MLMLAFGTRTDTTADPLIERTLALATEFMGLTGILSLAVSFDCPLLISLSGLFQGRYPTL